MPTPVYLCTSHKPPFGGGAVSPLTDWALIEAFNLPVLLGQHIKENLDGVSEGTALALIPARLESGLTKVVDGPIGPSVSGHIFGGRGFEGRMEECVVVHIGDKYAPPCSQVNAIV